VTGFFYAGSDGKWEGEPGFAYSLAAYEFQFTSLQTNEDVFEEEIRKLKANELTTVGNNQANLAIHYNLLLWMHFSTYFTVGDKVQSFGFSAEPGDVFNREYADFRLMSQTDFCSVDPKMSFDQTYGRMTIEYVFDETDTQDPFNSECTDIVAPSQFGYNEQYDKNVFTIEMDLVSLTSALAVNLGFVKTSHFEKTSSGFTLGTYNSDSVVEVDSLFDPRFPRMQPILCFTVSAGDGSGGLPDLGSGATDFEGKCVLRLGDVVIIPAFNHFGSQCQQCGSSTDDYCNEFDVVSSFVYFPSILNTSATDDDFNDDEYDDTNMIETMKLFNKYPNSKDLNDAVFDAYNIISYTDGTYSWDFGFCDYKCSLISLNSYDGLNKAMSPYFYNLDEGHCKDSTNKESFDSLGETPPTNLVEEYYRCKSTKTSAFFNSVGIANGNMLFFAPWICLFLLLPFIRSYHTYVVKEPLDAQNTVSEEVKQAALMELVTRLLDVTNGKVKKDPNSAVVQLANDLAEIGSLEKANRLDNSASDKL
jgi:hypothetical protein